MKVLWVVHARVLPVQTGAAIRTYNHVDQLVRRHEVTVVSAYASKHADPEYDNALRDRFPGAVPIPLPLKGQRWGAVHLRRAAAITGRTQARSRGHPAVMREVARLLALGRFDAVVADGLSAWASIPRAPGLPVVVFPHNAESQRALRQADMRPRRLQRLNERIGARRLAAFERFALSRADQVITVSEDDARQLRPAAGNTPVESVPTGVDLAEFPQVPLPEDQPPLVVFVGFMRYPPNVDAVLWFHEAIWPAILRAVPAAKLRVVGRDPDPRITRLASPVVEVTGTVPSVAPHLAEAAVVVVPLRAGGGTRLKIYEAMAIGRPVVSTTLGAEGLDVHPGEDIVLADTAADFGREVIALLRDPRRRRQLGEAAAKTAARHDWSEAGRAFEAILERAIARGPRAR